MEDLIIKISQVKPKFVAQTCPNCLGRSTVGYEKRPCPTCGTTEHPGIVLIPAEEVKNGSR